MDISILIVTKNRVKELELALNKIFNILDLSKHEILILIDGCSDTQKIIPKYNWVQWTFIEKSIGASPARTILYKKAKGTIFIGLDDDAHPISDDFINQVTNTFSNNPNSGIIAFQEIKGLFTTDEEAFQHRDSKSLKYKTTDFIGCGFAVKKEVYNETRGFPTWIDIYGEEPCLAIEVLDLGYDILYNSAIIVNHRIDKKQRLAQGRNYFRFEKQLKNTIYYYLVYYPKPTFKIMKLLFHNFKKYALTDKKCFVLFFKSIFEAMKNTSSVLKFRKPVSNETLQKIIELKGLKY
ncbi:glycosyltransferase family 2 protein [Flavobacterium panacagri]|uniref:glycosyltransferase family 2 protein n=1 Tax=Flavobacterium panacagri TaxID=3034146 RepID=UPI0025A530EB|nr:glycosyltransferase [Flavobacterium panacagri]